MATEEEIAEIKKYIKVVSANRQLNQKVMDSFKEPDDCFGREYNPEIPECRICLILVEIADERMPLNLLCCKLTGGECINCQEEWIPKDCPKEFRKTAGCLACSKMPECHNRCVTDVLDEVELMDRIVKEIDNHGEVYQGWLYRKLNAHRFKKEFNKAIEDLQKHEVIEAIQNKRGIILKRVAVVDASVNA
jgi:hypothetical protein